MQTACQKQPSGSPRRNRSRLVRWYDLFHCKTSDRRRLESAPTQARTDTYGVLRPARLVQTPRQNRPEIGPSDFIPNRPQNLHNSLPRRHLRRSRR